MSGSRFKGFSREAYQFLVDLKSNNERAWFQARKTEYERLLKEPLELLVAALAERFAERDIPLRADPAKSVFRIYRDVRFARDKSPYKTNVAAGFPWMEGVSAETTDRHGSGVGGYFHLSPEWTYVGGGMWHPEPAKLAAFRRSVDQEPERLGSIVEGPGFAKAFGPLIGDRLKRVPSGYPSDHPQAEILKLKDVGFGREVTPREAGSARLPELIADTFEAGLPLMRFLANLPA